MLILFYLLLFLLPTQLGRHFWPLWSYIDGIRVDYLSPILYVTDILSLLLVLFALLSPQRKEYFSLSKRSCIILLVSLVVWFVSILSSHNPFFGWYELLKFVEFLLVFLITKKLLSDPAKFKTAAIVFCSGLLFQSLLAITQVLLQHSVGGLMWFFGERMFSASTPGIATASLHGQQLLRGYGTLSHPNVLAGLLIIGVIWLGSLSVTPRRISWFRILFFVVAFCGMLATMSRLPLAIFILYILWFLRKKLWVTAITIIGFFGLLWTSAGDRILHTTFQEESIQERIFLFEKTWNQLQSRIVFGLGFGKFITGSTVGSVISNGTPQPVHNIFLLVLSEVGLVGILPIIYFCIHLVKRAWESSLGLWLLVTYLILGSFDHYFLTLQQGQLASMLVFAIILRDNI